MTTDPQSDPIERVARVLAEYCIGDFEEFDIESRHLWLNNAGRAVDEYKAWLTEQGIPIDKLLSGEMKVVPTFSRMQGGNEPSESTTSIESQ